jgi:hypothetical protein
MSLRKVLEAISKEKKDDIKKPQGLTLTALFCLFAAFLVNK